MRRVLITVRNVLADNIARLVYRIPALEQPFVGLGRLSDKLPFVRTIYRRSMDTLLAKLCANGRQYRICKVARDVSFIFDVSDFTAGSWYFKKALFEPLTTAFFLDELKAGQTVLDIGANRGYLTVLAALRVGKTGRVYSFEPNPRVAADLKRHIALNHLDDRVTCVEMALSHHNANDVRFFVSNDISNSGLSSLQPAKELLDQKLLSENNVIGVRTVTLDHWAQQEKLGRPVDLMKIDVEGGEMAVLEGARQLLEETPPRNIVCETVPGGPACQLLMRYGYHTRFLDRGGDKVNILFHR